jgi:predicted N-formylglutamate amidohydrolase
MQLARSSHHVNQFSDPADSPPVEIFAPQAKSPCLIVCDHASPRIPAHLANLGLAAEELNRHIAWDIGAAAVGRRLAGRLGATAVLSMPRVQFHRGYPRRCIRAAPRVR